MYYILFSVFIIIICILIVTAYKKKLSQTYIKQKKEKLISRIESDIFSFRKAEKEITEEIERKLARLHEIEKQITISSAKLEEWQDSIKKYEIELRAQAEERAEQYKRDYLKFIEDKIRLKEEELRMQSQQRLEEEMSILGNRALQAQNELDRITSVLQEYTLKQQNINKAILKQKEIQERQDFYRICLSNEAKSDINYLLSISSSLKNPTILYKLIWSEYVQHPFQQMLKNVLGATDPKNVIYAITNLKTNEIYVGKTKGEVSKRWTEHIKSSLNIGTIKTAKIHEALYNNWDSFSFTIIEKVVSESSLSEREKFYIDFYQSNIYGYNLKSGG